jgi:O-antigen ligase
MRGTTLGKVVVAAVSPCHSGRKCSRGASGGAEKLGSRAEAWAREASQVLWAGLDLHRSSGSWGADVSHSSRPGADEMSSKPGAARLAKSDVADYRNRGGTFATSGGSASAVLATVLASSVLGLCLFGDCKALGEARVFGGVLGEVGAAVGDPGTQWMIFVCAGIYFVTLTVVRERLGGRGASGEAGKWKMEDVATGRGESGGGRIEDGISIARTAWCLAAQWVGKPASWQAGLVGLAGAAYAFHYAEAAHSTHALVLLGGAVLGQGAAFWESRKGKAESRNGAGGTVVGALVVLLLAAAAWQAEIRYVFQYRGETRWSGPWDNPNMFGALMGVGVVLAVGSALRGWGMEDGRWQRGEHRTSNIKHSTSNVWAWTKRALLLGAAGVMVVGLVKSYSRGAWIGTAMGMGYLGWQMLKSEKLKAEIPGGRPREAEHRTSNTEPRRLSRWGAVTRNSGALAVIAVSLGVSGFWSFRHTERSLARRAYSVANANDFSWRNRAAAYEGALRMMAEKPWFGLGWNQPERVYDRYYRAAKVDEGMAIQLNDYLMLGMTLGVPALLCFVMYVGLALVGPRRTSNIERGASDFGLWALGLAAVCRAGAVVLAVGFWFDGGLFKLATGATFWVLLELGAGKHVEREEADVNRGPWTSGVKGAGCRV